MSRSKVAITLDVETLDKLVKDRVFPDRSRAIQEAVEEEFERLERKRLAEECAKLDATLEKDLAEEGMSEESSHTSSYVG